MRKGNWRKPESLAVRLERNSVPEPNSGCLLWTGAVRKGMPVMDTARGGGHPLQPAARIAYELRFGVVLKAGNRLAHSCKTSVCINPEHLVPHAILRERKARSRMVRAIAPWREATTVDDLLSGYKRAKTKVLIDALKTGPCSDCGGRFPSCAMQFDHLEPAKKVAGVGDMAGDGRSVVRLFAEIAKCELVCANCHAVRTERQRLAGVFKSKTDPRSHPPLTRSSTGDLSGAEFFQTGGA